MLSAWTLGTHPPPGASLAGSCPACICPGSAPTPSHPLHHPGELNRYAILRATKRDVVAVQQAKDLVESIFFAFIQFDLRNGSLRKKYDALKVRGGEA